MDPMEQLTTVVLPALITKMKEQKQDLQDTKEDLHRLALEMADVMRDHVGRIDALERDLRDVGDALAAFTNDLNEALVRIDALEAKAAEQPKTKTRKRKAKTEPDGVTPAPAFTPKVTGDDILHANHALVACKGNVAEARMCDPSLTAEQYEYISGLTTEQVLDLVVLYPVTDETIPLRYAQANWKEIQK